MISAPITKPVINMPVELDPAVRTGDPRELNRINNSKTPAMAAIIFTVWVNFGILPANLRDSA
jgi:hypothetical protein